MERESMYQVREFLGIYHDVSNWLKVWNKWSELVLEPVTTAFCKFKKKKTQTSQHKQNWNYSAILHIKTYYKRFIIQRTLTPFY